MKKVVMLTAVMLMFLVTTAGAQPNAVKGVNPPKGLQWNMSFDKVVTYLETTYPKAKNFKKYKDKKVGKLYREIAELDIPKTCTRIQVKPKKKTFSLLKKNPDYVYLIFDEDKNLTSFDYIFTWNNADGPFGTKDKGMRKSWVFYTTLLKRLILKYDKPVNTDDFTFRGKPIASGTTYETLWDFPDGSKLRILITRQVHNIIIATADFYAVVLIYTASSFDHNSQRTTSVKDDDI